MTAIPSDVAGARQAEDAQSIRLEAAVSNMAQGLCTFDANQRMVICNQQAIFSGRTPITIAMHRTISEFSGCLCRTGGRWLD